MVEVRRNRLSFRHQDPTAISGNGGAGKRGKEKTSVLWRSEAM
jgi:hypothetical protein